MAEANRKLQKTAFFTRWMAAAGGDFARGGAGLHDLNGRDHRLVLLQLEHAHGYFTQGNCTLGR